MPLLADYYVQSQAAIFSFSKRPSWRLGGSVGHHHHRVRSCDSHSIHVPDRGVMEAENASITTRRRLMQGTAVSFCSCASTTSIALASQSQPNPDGVWPGRWGWYDRYFALAMTNMEDYEREIEPLKRRLHRIALTPGCTLLELGMGTGPNLRYQNACPEVHVTGIDVNTAMAPYARQAADAAALPQSRLRLVTGDIQNMPFQDSSFDVVVSTLVLCSVENVATVLAHVARVLKPGGRFLFIEHVLAPSSDCFLQVFSREILTLL